MELFGSCEPGYSVGHSSLAGGVIELKPDGIEGWGPEYKSALHQLISDLDLVGG